jgi:hypothetical protein
VPKSKPNKTGPLPETLDIEGDWKEAIKKALKKKRPASGWPAPKPKTKKAPKD